HQTRLMSPFALSELIVKMVCHVLPMADAPEEGGEVTRCHPLSSLWNLDLDFIDTQILICCKLLFEQFWVVVDFGTGSGFTKLRESHVLFLNPFRFFNCHTKLSPHSCHSALRSPQC